MLQEDFASLITRDLAIYSCLTFLEDPDWNTVRPPPPPEAALDSGEEVIYLSITWNQTSVCHLQVIIYVKHLKNPFFDDHFDLQEPKHLVGKTLYVAGMARTDLLGRSAQVHGLALQEKWEKGVSLLETLVQQGESLLLDEVSAETLLEPYVWRFMRSKPPYFTDPSAPSRITACSNVETHLRSFHQIRRFIRSENYGNASFSLKCHVYHCITAPLMKVLVHSECGFFNIARIAYSLFRKGAL